jgi:hypothetical protein
MRKNIFLIAALLILLAGSFQSAQAQKREELLDGQISFTLPKGFQETKKDSLNFRFYLHNPEKIGCCLSEEIFAYRNDKNSIEIGIGFIPPDVFKGTGRGVSARNLPKIKLEIEKMTKETIGNVKWRKSENLIIRRKKFIHLVFETPPASGGSVHEFYMTDFQGNLMVFAISAPASVYNKESALIASITRSLKVDPFILEAPVGVPSN